MSGDEAGLRQMIARHEREIGELQRQVDELKSGHAKERLEAELASRMAQLDADIKLQELQEEMAKEEAEKQRKRRHWWSG